MKHCRPTWTLTIGGVRGNGKDFCPKMCGVCRPNKPNGNGGRPNGGKEPGQGGGKEPGQGQKRQLLIYYFVICTNKLTIIVKDVFLCCFFNHIYFPLLVIGFIGVII